jgi:hypothetical protein
VRRREVGVAGHVCRGNEYVEIKSEQPGGAQRLGKSFSQ